MNRDATPYSNLKIFHHMDVIQALGEGKRVAPIYIRLKPTNVCNHKCYYCSYADSELGLRDSVDKKDMIPHELMLQIIDDMKDMGVKAVTFSGGGEPLTYPFIEEAMSGILDSGIDLSIITNGQLLRDKKAELLSGAKWVRISFDSANAETYSKVRNLPLSAFDEVCNNIKNFAQIKNPKCELGINFVINHENADQVYNMAKMVKSLGVNHIKFAARITKDLFEYHEPFKDKVIEDLKRASEDLSDSTFKIIDLYASDFDTAMVFHRGYHRCYINRIFTVIAADSKVYFCHDKAYVSSGVVGDLKEKSFKEIWFDPEVVKRYEEFDASCECDHHCVYDSRNMLLNSYYDMDLNHVNFI